MKSKGTSIIAAKQAKAKKYAKTNLLLEIGLDRLNSISRLSNDLLI